MRRALRVYFPPTILQGKLGELTRPRRVEGTMITGQSPRFQWQPNPEGQIRTAEEAEAIAKKHGVQIPEDVEFFPDELNESP